MKQLTSRQQKVLEFIRRAFRRQGYPPTIKEIGDHLGVKWTHGVERHLEALEKKGYIVRVRDKSRAIKLVGASAEPVMRSVPVLGRIAAGRPVLAVENVDTYMAVDASIARWKECFLLRVDGMSMRDAGILHGDYILVRQQESADSGAIVAALVGGEEATVKRLRLRAKSVVLEPANPDFAAMTFDPDAVRILGRVTAVVRVIEN